VPLPPGAWQPFPALPVAMEGNGPDGYTLTDLTTGQRRAYAIARPADTPLDRLRLALAGMPDEALGWLVPVFMSGRPWPDGLGGFLPESREAIMAVRAACAEALGA
jgi:hypothetical protein